MFGLKVAIYTCFEFCVIGCFCKANLEHWLLTISICTIGILATAGYIQITLHTSIQGGELLFILASYRKFYIYSMHQLHWNTERLCSCVTTSMCLFCVYSVWFKSQETSFALIFNSIYTLARFNHLCMANDKGKLLRGETAHHRPYSKGKSKTRQLVSGWLQSIKRKVWPQRQDWRHNALFQKMTTESRRGWSGGDHNRSCAKQWYWGRRLLLMRDSLLLQEKALELLCGDTALLQLGMLQAMLERQAFWG